MPAATNPELIVCPGGTRRVRSWVINVIFDLDGVLWHGSEPIRGAPEAVARLIGSGHDVLFATNNSWAPLARQEDKLAGLGVDATGRVVSSATAAASLVESGTSVFVLGGPGVAEAVRARGAETVAVAPVEDGPPQVDAVIAGLDFDLTYDRLRMAVTAVRNGARFIGTNHDPTFPSEHGLLAGGGSIVAAVATGAETPPVFAGKPHQPMADLAVSRLGAGGLMIGDRPDTDGLFARRMGYRFGLVLSGVTSAQEAAELDPQPDLIAADVPALLELELELGFGDG